MEREQLRTDVWRLREMADYVERLYSDSDGEVSDSVESWEEFVAQDAELTMQALVEFLQECNDAVENTKRERERLDERKRRFESRISWAKERIVEVFEMMGTRKADVGNVEVSLRRGAQKVIAEEGADLWMLPEDCRRVVPEHAQPDKKAIAARLKKGERFPGFHLVRSPDSVVLK